MQTRYRKDGGRTVELFLPFRIGRRRVTQIEFGPVTLGHVMRWRDEKAGSSIINMMADLAGMPIEDLQQVRFPDVDRIMTVFMEMLPSEVRDALASPPLPQMMPQSDVMEPPPTEVAQEDEHLLQPTEPEEQPEPPEESPPYWEPPKEFKTPAGAYPPPTKEEVDKRLAEIRQNDPLGLGVSLDG